MSPADTLTIDPRYNGPAGSGNGGVTAGMAAELLGSDHAVTVTLRLPPPLARPLRVERGDQGLRIVDRDGSHADDGGAIVAEAVVSTDRPAPVPPVSGVIAAQAAQRYDGLHEHPFPTCFVCGTDRPDGLGLRPGTVDPADRSVVAAPLTVPAGLGLSGPVLVWAALDCPGGWAIDLVGRRAVLGRMTAQVYGVPVVGEPCVITAVCERWDGRKAFSRSSCYGADGGLLGIAAQTWIELR
ncbi:hypothetical protein M6D93_02365 [Jatrophihabitans telluris]|uniref:Thioesterase family protein n=1 Tax=Jatrophihabitans telluris TaxID=2038343 RepID=A0ABY4QYV4_9ACTN|nr:hypothetical protein [Jatrophihabitans telluris]UQX88856.1 hypothetical protein M6D93_02365 [Jatrophihabitans telluris]